MRCLNGIWLDFQLLRGGWATVDPRNLLQYHNLHNLQQVQQYVGKMPYSCCSKTHNLEHWQNQLSPQILSFQNQLLRTQRRMQQLMQLHGNLRSAPTHLFRINGLLLANNGFASKYIISEIYVINQTISLPPAVPLVLFAPAVRLLGFPEYRG